MATALGGTLDGRSGRYGGVHRDPLTGVSPPRIVQQNLARRSSRWAMCSGCGREVGFLSIGPPRAEQVAPVSREPIYLTSGETCCPRAVSKCWATSQEPFPTFSHTLIRGVRTVCGCTLAHRRRSATPAAFVYTSAYRRAGEKGIGPFSRSLRLIG